MGYIENDSEIRLRKRELKFFNERNVCPFIGHLSMKNLRKRVNILKVNIYF